MSSTSFINYVKAGYPVLWVKSYEEFRVLSEYVYQLSQINVKEGDTPYKTFTWDLADGIHPVHMEDKAIITEPTEVLNSDSSEVKAKKTAMSQTKEDAMAPLEWLDSQTIVNEKGETVPEENIVLFLKDYHPFLKPEYKDSVLINRKIRNLIGKFKSLGKVLIILSPEVKIPTELDKEISVIDYKLPTREELKLVLKEVCETFGIKYPTDSEEVLNAALGMTSFEAENAFCVSLVEKRTFDSLLIRREKSSIVKKTGLLEVVESDYTMNDIGGLENLKGWLDARKNNFLDKAVQFGLKSPKGLLMVGVPGSGKSLSAKAVASSWKRPLLRLDMGNVFGSYVGESEGNMNRVLDIAEAVSPCILWIK